MRLTILVAGQLLASERHRVFDRVFDVVTMIEVRIVLHLF
jgi:hypothetical protein